ncbi:putative oxidoreductase OrdL [Lachnellula suecica]|uniref:Putative oxidoreductase OrdL n=1 Tax=Lachnellula suecica TaxID=602035 RepID=A0A8T9BV20_9HELO|nr:putative oxidoreductase OrdL [Lachnellula suecica]
MDERASIPVSLPHPTPLPSYWQARPLSSHQESDALPGYTDTLIIGSGITGATIAWNLLSRGVDTDVTMLEARGVCDGATGRNGGHTKAASYRSFPDNIKNVGIEQAKKIARLELANIRATHAFAKRHGIECESRRCETVDVYFDQTQWEACVSAVGVMRDAFGDEDEGLYKLWSAAEARARFRVEGEGVVGAVSYEAGSIKADSFVGGVLRLCLEKGLKLYAHSPVTELRRVESGWDVVTQKGMVRAKRVVLATNGYTAHLLPLFQGKIVPLRGQVTAHRPGSNLPPSGLQNTYSFMYENGYDYMIPRPAGTEFPGDIIIGGGLSKAKDEGLYEYGETDDSLRNADISEHLHESTARYFGDAWGADSTDGRVRREWTGVMGYSPDGFPFVGEVPGMEGVWIAAAFQGHGMVFCWESARALVGLMNGEDVDEWFPSSFKVTEERLEKRFKGRLHTKASGGEGV